MPSSSKHPSMKAPPKRKGNRVEVGSVGVAVPPSMKAPPKRKGNPQNPTQPPRVASNPLNESPSEKEGKSPYAPQSAPHTTYPSMKAPPKRKGNSEKTGNLERDNRALNESPSEKEGKYESLGWLVLAGDVLPSMKAPPKRKGNRLRENL